MPGWNFGKCNCCDGGGDDDNNSDVPCGLCAVTPLTYTLTITSAIKDCRLGFGGTSLSLDRPIPNGVWVCNQIPSLPCRWVSDPEDYQIVTYNRSDCRGPKLLTRYFQCRMIIQFDQFSWTIGMETNEAQPFAIRANPFWRYVFVQGAHDETDCRVPCSVSPSNDPGLTQGLLDMSGAIISVNNCIEGI